MGVFRAAVRGKCRFCDRSVSSEHYGWASEDGDPEPYDCLAAPQVLHSPCDGLGKILDEEESKRLGRDVFVRCNPCRGSGYVPGPHWPWRHPPTAL